MTDSKQHSDSRSRNGRKSVAPFVIADAQMPQESKPSAKGRHPIHPPAIPKVIVMINTSFGDCDGLLSGISRFHRDHGGWDVFVDDGAAGEFDPAWLAEQAWNGVICRTTTKKLVEVCAERGLPLIDINDCPPFPGVPKVRPDNLAVGHMAAEDLYERGFRNFYYSGYDDQSWSLQRREGFFEALSLLGCTAQEFSMPSVYCMRPAQHALEIDRIAAWLKTLSLPAGILAAHDLRGRQVLAAAQQLRLMVPEELAVIGVNNDVVRCELSVPTLSSVATDTFRTGYLAAEELSRRMAGDQSAAAEVKVEPTKIVTRNSTDSFAIEDRAISTALSIIRQEACKGITVKEVVRRATIPRARLERGFRLFVGRSPQAEIRRIQLLRIKQLLTETDFPLKQIALLTAFEHVEYLNVSFKRAVGETPGRFRRLARMAPGSGKISGKPMAVAPAA
jgi:LacI family transcriptional regulator